MSLKIVPKLKEQKIVPSFTLPATNNQKITISQFKQRKNVVLYFFGKTDCKLCRKRLIDLKEHFSNLEHLNAITLAISPEPLDALKKLKNQLQLPFELLSDKDLKATSLYTQLKSSKDEPYPSLFVIDKYNVLYAQALEEKEEDLPPLKDIQRVLHAIEIECPECGFFPGSTSI